MKPSVLVAFLVLLPQASQAAGRKAAPSEVVYPPPPDAPRVRFIRSVSTRRDLTGTKAALLGKLIATLTGASVDGPIVRRPYGIWVRDGRLYLSDVDEQRVVRVSLADGKVQFFGEGGPGDLLTPIGVCSDPGGNIYVSDTGDHSVKSFAADGAFRWKADALETAGKLSKPSGIAWTPAGEVLVADSGNGRLVWLASDGKFLREGIRNMKDPFALPNPGNLWVEQDGSVIVSDPLLSRVHLFPSSGKAFGFGEPGDSAGYLARPKGVASDSDGNIHVVDAVFNRIQIFDRRGRLLMYYGAPGAGPGDLALPAGIFVDDGDRVYVVDSKNKRVQIYQYLRGAQAPAAPSE